ncbi:MAG: type II toxin-antitoxin system RelE/ParE family toxin [Ginsengibacter sp.]
MVQLIWSERAIKDPDSIGEYIALDSEQAAKKFIQQLIEKANILSLYPGKGRPIPENIPGNYRQILHKSYRIIYRLHKETVIISSIYNQKKLLFKIENT